MQSPNRWRVATYAVAISAAIAVSIAIAPPSSTDVAGPDGTVAVLSVDGLVTSESAGAVTEELGALRSNESVDAVVLQVDSPGGAVGASESLYLSVRETAAQKPVVASVSGQAASGGYMAVLGSHRVYTTPSSRLGSVGVYGQLPPAQLSNVENVLTSAPTKGTAGTPEEVRRSVERMKRTFVGLVFDERGDDLVVDRETVSRAKVYTGKRAVELGFADAIGGRRAAIGSAAERAGLEEYSVTSIDVEDPGVPAPFASESVDATRYFALHGLPADATERPADAGASGENGSRGSGDPGIVSGGAGR